MTTISTTAPNARILRQLATEDRRRSFRKARRARIAAKRSFLTCA